MNPCCPYANFSLGNLVSSTKVSVAGEDVTVEYYLTLDSTEGAGKHSMPIKIIIIKFLKSLWIDILEPAFFECP